MAITVTIVDDHPLAIAGIQTILAISGDITVLNTFLNATTLLERLKIVQPDVLLLDIILPDMKGSEVAQYVKKQYPAIKIIALTSLDAPSMVRSMMHAGCNGYLLKGTDQHTLIAAINAVYDGEEFIEPALKEQMLQTMLKARKSNPIAPASGLTKREKEILMLIAAELTTQQIAEKLFISVRTAETHRYSLMQKLEVKNTAGLIKAAIQLGLVE